MSPVSEDPNEREQHGTSYHTRPLWDGWSQPTKPSEALALGENYARMEGLWCSGILFNMREEPEPEHNYWESEFVRGSNYSSRNQHRDRRCQCSRCKGNRKAAEDLRERGLGCGDIKACSTGILIMAVLDGPAVNAYFNPKLLNEVYGQVSVEYIEQLLTKDPIGGASCLFLYAGMARLVRERTPSAGDEFEPLEIDSEWSSGTFRPNDPVLDIEKFIAGPQPGPRGGKPLLTIEKFREKQANYYRARVIEINDGVDDDETDDTVSRLPVTKGEEYHEAIVKSFQYGKEFALKWEGKLGFRINVEPSKTNEDE